LVFRRKDNPRPARRAIECDELRVVTEAAARLVDAAQLVLDDRERFRQRLGYWGDRVKELEAKPEAKH